MSKISLTDLSNLQNENTAIAAINSNNAILEAAMDNTLSRDGTSPNQMSSTLDMNSNRIINLPNAIGLEEPVTLGQVDAVVQAVVEEGITIGTSPVFVSTAMQPVVGSTTLSGAATLLGVDYTTITDPGIDSTGTTASDTAFQAAVAAHSYLVIPKGSTVRLSQNFTIPSGKVIRIDNGGSLKVDSGKTITINGIVEAGQYWIFNGAGSVVGLRKVMDAWFGTHGRIFNANSTTSVAIGTGNKTFTVGAGLNIDVGKRVRAYASPLAVLSTANNGSGLVRVTLASTALFTTGGQIRISGVTGTTEANGLFTATVVDGSHVDLQGTTYANAYVSGGLVQPFGFFVEGPVVSYSGTTLVIGVDTTLGAGAITSWTIDANDSAALASMVACVQDDSSIVSDGGEIDITLRSGNLILGNTLVFSPSVLAQLRVTGAGTGLGGTSFFILPDHVGPSAIQIAGSNNDLLGLANFIFKGFFIANNYGSFCQIGLQVGCSNAQLQSTGAVNLIEDLAVSEFSYGFYIRNTRLVEFRRCLSDITTVTNGYAMIFDVDPTGGTTYNTGDIDVYGMRIVCTSNTGATSVALFNNASPATSPGLAAIHFHGGEFYRAATHIRINASNGAYIGDIVFDNYLQADGPAGDAVIIQATDTGTNISKVNFLNIWMDVEQTSGWTISQGTGSIIQDVMIMGCELNFNSGTAFLISGGTGIKIDHNRLLGANPGAGNPVARFSGNTTCCSFDSNTIVTTYPGGAANYFVQWDAGNDYFTCLGNNTGGYPGLTGVVNDLTSTSNKAIANNF